MSECKQFQVDEIKINGVPVAFDDGSGLVKNYIGYTNEEVPSALGDNSYKRKRVTPTLEFKQQTAKDFDLPAGECEITFRDIAKDKRGRVSKAVIQNAGDVGGGDSAGVSYWLLSKIQWL